MYRFCVQEAIFPWKKRLKTVKVTAAALKNPHIASRRAIFKRWFCSQFTRYSDETLCTYSLQCCEPHNRFLWYRNQNPQNARPLLLDRRRSYSTRSAVSASYSSLLPLPSPRSSPSLASGVKALRFFDRNSVFMATLTIISNILSFHEDWISSIKSKNQNHTFSMANERFYENWSYADSQAQGMVGGVGGGGGESGEGGGLFSKTFVENFQGFLTIFNKTHFFIKCGDFTRPKGPFFFFYKKNFLLEIGNIMG